MKMKSKVGRKGKDSYLFLVGIAVHLLPYLLYPPRTTAICGSLCSVFDFLGEQQRARCEPSRERRERRRVEGRGSRWIDKCDASIKKTTNFVTIETK